MESLLVRQRASTPTRIAHRSLLRNSIITLVASVRCQMYPQIAVFQITVFRIAHRSLTRKSIITLVASVRFQMYPQIARLYLGL